MGSWDKLGYIAFKMAATKSSKDAGHVGLSSWRHEKRCEVREKSTKGNYFRSSLQCLDNNEILLLLESILPRSKQGTQTANCTVRGLRAVQEHLMHGYGCIWKKPTIYILHSVNFPVQINKPSEINCLILITVCLSTKSRQRDFFF